MKQNDPWNDAELNWTTVVSGEHQSNHEHKWIKCGFWNLAIWKDCKCGAEMWPMKHFEEASKPTN